MGLEIRGMRRRDDDGARVTGYKVDAAGRSASALGRTVREESEAVTEEHSRYQTHTSKKERARDWYRVNRRLEAACHSSTTSMKKLLSHTRQWAAKNAVEI